MISNTLGVFRVFSILCMFFFYVWSLIVMCVEGREGIIVTVIVF